jgi:bifunctional DNase/RNase
MTMKKVSRERPQTHDLISRIFQGLGAKVDRIVVNDFHDGVFYGRLIIHMDNEIGEKKIVEIDARPSDCLAIALQESCSIYVAQHVWDGMDDMSEILYKMEDQDLGFTKDED